MARAGGNRLRRLDAELVKRQMAKSREQAREMILGGRVSVNGIVASKPATGVDGEVSIRVTVTDDDRWASRGAHKLLGALAVFEPLGLDLAGTRVLDAGASTGGFTDVCLDRGVTEVLAVDVGYGQLVWRLRNDPRVTVLDRTNVRTLTPDQLGGQVDAMVGDLSFISLELVLPALAGCVREGGSLLPMVKPQFEVGKDRLGHGGVVRSPELRAEVTLDVARRAAGLGLSTRAVTASPLPGPSGNVEYFLWLIRDGGETSPTDDQLQTMVETAVKEGPQ
ncbi:TlyA family RNA methyltransferase [Corynebacterium provencense]|uniref:16S/23S rRNA (Cytidine-2'-O)-methyltransferase TlyA n=1 Tax=Corynebacterium provencense TaxID=1737425 RepID=A0A2Z3YRM5_9CORY|nr:TlyA family RNA methyltransferase [Corynebacterium provencense]AWT26301.1 16S/23S rRNA (cytidine-2'-O)-methyltransferase TlyA [Corynebacterium provencense]